MGSMNKTKNSELKTQNLLILHGWAYDTSKWDLLIAELEKSNMPFKMLKIPGLTAPLDEVWSLADYLEWLSREVKKIDGKVVLLGHSNGGRIASAFTAQNPEKVAELILIDSAGIISRSLKTKLKKVTFASAAKIGKRFIKSNLLKNLLYKAAREQDYNEANPIVKKTMVNLISADLESVFAKIKVPTLIIWGENDRVTPLSDGKKIHSLILGSKFEIIKGAKHSPQFTNSEEVFSLVKKFV